MRWKPFALGVALGLGLAAAGRDGRAGAEAGVPTSDAAERAGAALEGAAVEPLPQAARAMASAPARASRVRTPGSQHIPGRGTRIMPGRMANAFNAEGLPQPFGIFSSAAWATEGRPLFISGQVAQDASGQLIGEGDIKAQTRAVLDSIGAILKQAGGTFDDIAVVNVYVLDMNDLKA